MKSLNRLLLVLKASFLEGSLCSVDIIIWDQLAGTLRSFHLLEIPLVSVLQFRKFVFRRISRMIIQIEDHPKSKMIAALWSPAALMCIANTCRTGTRRDATRWLTTTSIADSYGPVESSELTEALSPLGQADAGVRGEWRGIVELGWLRVRASHGFSAPLRSARVSYARYHPRPSWSITISALDARSEYVYLSISS